MLPSSLVIPSVSTCHGCTCNTVYRLSHASSLRHPRQSQVQTAPLLGLSWRYSCSVPRSSFVPRRDLPYSIVMRGDFWRITACRFPSWRRLRWRTGDASTLPILLLYQSARRSSRPVAVNGWYAFGSSRANGSVSRSRLALHFGYCSFSTTMYRCV